jgi:hypothetical protein
MMTTIIVSVLVAYVVFAIAGFAIASVERAAEVAGAAIRRALKGDR